MSPARAALMSALIDDGRASVEALARATGLSVTHTRQLLASLSADHIEVRGIVHPSVFGQHAMAHLLITPARGVEAAVDALVADPAIPYITRVAGDAAIAAEVRVADRAALARHIHAVRALPEIARVDVDEYLDIVKDASTPVHPLGDLQLDRIDRVVLYELQIDGRASYASLARVVDLTTASARARVLRLIESGVVHIGVRQRARDDALQIGFRLVSTGSVGVEHTLIADPAVEYLATSVGRSSFVGTLRVDSAAAAARQIDTLHRLDGVERVWTWMHLTVIKEMYAAQDIPETSPERTRR